ncbi:MAG: acetylxylan esterase [Dysgonamonadaceae bacterium]|jgi:cephalosporin-C deacetylase-like acetyl esterase|nr:acetylxylan esterase [Dysgonamonadaceae bacterium]
MKRTFITFYSSKVLLCVFFTLFTTTFLIAQPAQRLIEVSIAPDHDNWTYKTGEKVKFFVEVAKKDVLLKNVELRYEISEDMMPARESKTITLKDGKATIDAGTMKTSGFLRCLAYAKYEGRNYEGRATAGFDPEKIQPTTTLPADFIEFWENAKAENAKIPLDPVTTLLPDRCTDKVNVYQVGIQNYRYGGRIYGTLCVPTAPGKYPAVLKVPGAGIRPYGADVATAAKGVIILEIGIHGIPINMPNNVYTELDRGALSGYQVSNLDNRDEYYYKRVYLGCVRAVDYIFSMPQFDGKNVVVNGGSQGGALSIVTAGLDSRIKGLAAFYPALADLTGYVNGRAGGWPHMFRNADKKDPAIAKKIENSKYYDVVNFARQIKVPGFYSFGYNDMVCPPTSTYSAYNVITAPKELFLVEETAHWTYPEQWDVCWKWIFDKLK